MKEVVLDLHIGDMEVAAPEKCEFFADLGDTLDLMERRAENFYMCNDNNQKLEVLAPASMKKKAEQVEDLIEVAGLRPILKKVISFIRYVSPNYPISRLSLATYNYETGAVSIDTSEGMDFWHMEALLHEAGHGLNTVLLNFSGGRSLFYKYAMMAVTEEPVFSSYAKAYAYVDGRNSRKYLEECFADDFRLFWMRPEALGVSKRGVFEEIIDFVFSDVDVEEVRRRIRMVLGNYYGRDVASVLYETNDLVAREMARGITRRRFSR